MCVAASATRPRPSIPIWSRNSVCPTPIARSRGPMRSWKSLPGKMMAAIAVEGLTRRYGVVAAADGISFDVRAGEVFGLLGPNGAGKTTTLECILGLNRPDVGRITVYGLAPRDARAKVGAVLQATGLQEKITPREALEISRSFYPRAVPADALIDRFGLREKQGA